MRRSRSSRAPKANSRQKPSSTSGRPRRCCRSTAINWDAVADVTGEDDSENWAGHKIELYPTTTEMKGKMVDCIRIRLPEQPELPKTRQKPLKKSGAAEKPPLSEEMSDEIPF